MATATASKLNPASLEDRLEQIERKLDVLIAQLRAASAAPRHAENDGAHAPSAAGAASQQPDVATDFDLDSPRGNPEVRFVPKRWNGPDMKGKRFSECPPEFLDMLADAFEWFARRDDEAGAVDKNNNPKSKWGRLDASRARGWARRIRTRGPQSSGVGGSSSPATSFADIPGVPGASEEDIPF